MKKVISIISIAAIAMVLVFSCAKEEATNKPATKHELTAYETHINKTLKDFKQKMEFIRANPQLKSGESVPADSAVWLLEATINFSHAFPNEFYSEFETDSLTLTVARNADGTVDMEELTGKYDEMKQAVADAYHNSGYEVKGLAVVDLEEAVITESEIDINVQVLTGEKGNEPPPGPPVVDGPFVEGDDWWYGENYGYCYDHTVFGDASIMLYDEAVNLVPDPNGNYGFINLFTFWIEGGDPYFQRYLTPDNYLDYWLYYSVEGDPQIPFDEQVTLCVERQEMNAYYAYLRGLMFDILPNHYLPEVLNKFGYSIESFNNLDWKKYDDNPPYTSYLHKATFTYGIKINYGEGEGPEEL
jgi:hypothetical protein